MIAVGTKLIVAQAKKKTYTKGDVIIPDMHQVDPILGLVLSVGSGGDSESAMKMDAFGLLDVVWFNPEDQFSGKIGDAKGRVDFLAIDFEAVLAVMTRTEAEVIFGAEFPEIPADVAELFTVNA